MFIVTFHLGKVHHDRLKVWASDELLEVCDLGTGHDNKSKNICKQVQSSKDAMNEL